MLRWVLVLLLFIGAPISSIGQSDSLKAKIKLVEVELQSGKEYQGIILYQSSDLLRLKLANGTEIEFSTDSLTSLHYLEPVDLVRRYAQTRYFFAPNAFNLKKGEAYYQNAWILFNQVSVGFSDYFTLGVGTIPLFLFDPQVLGPLWITPKISYPLIKDRVNIAAGGLYGTVLGENITFGITYGSISIGNIDNNATFSMGYGRSDGQWANRPTIAFSGMLKADNHFYLITENYFLDNFFLISFGGRYDFRKLSLDFGLIGAEEFEGSLIPWLGVTVPFRYDKPKKS